MAAWQLLFRSRLPFLLKVVPLCSAAKPPRKVCSVQISFRASSSMISSLLASQDVTCKTTCNRIRTFRFGALEGACQHGHRMNARDGQSYCTLYTRKTIHPHTLSLSLFGGGQSQHPSEAAPMVPWFCFFASLPVSTGSNLADTFTSFWRGNFLLLQSQWCDSLPSWNLQNHAQ
jgi:hypothetical protein